LTAQNLFLSSVAKTFLDLADGLKGGDAMSTLYLIAWHARENRPGGYVADLWTDGSSQKSQVFSESDAEAVAETIATRSKLHETRAGYLNGTPMPDAGQCEAAGFELRDADE
jgi:hypothetical protein